MNKKTKKCGVFAALAAALIITAALVTTCVDPIVPGDLPASKGKQITDFVPPPGKGYVMLDFGEAGSGRTVKPITTDYNTLEDFGCFDVVFTASGDSDNDETHPHLAYTAVEGPFSLQPDSYSVAVFAYPAGNTTGGDPTAAIAWGQTEALSPLVVVGGSGTTTPTVALKEIATTAHGGTGVLRLNLSNIPSGDNFAATLTVDTYPTPTVPPPIPGVTVTSTLASYTSGTALTPGFYRVSLALSQDEKQSVTVREILHIYQGMTSTFAGALPNLKTNVYTITFNPAGGAAYTPLPAGINKVPHGWTIGGTTLGGAGAAPTNQPTRTDYDFVEWVTTSGGSTAWDFATGKPIKNTTLFAKWTLSSSTGAAITITIDWPTGAVLPQFKVSDADDGTNAAITTLSFTHGTAKTLKFTVTNASVFTGAWDWAVDDDSVTFTASTTDTFELDIGSFDFTLGPLVITAGAMHTGTAKPEFNSVTITIAE